MSDVIHTATVSQLTAYIKKVFDANKVMSNIWVKGEISNYKRHTSGHIYMTLKDDGAVIRAVMFRGAANGLTFVPENGAKVAARGRVAVFERDGQYQLYVEEMTPDGFGDLHLRFLELKDKLAKEGLFDSKYKKPIPLFPKAVGLVTGETGAAVQDMLNVISRRYKLCDIYFYPVLVQGNKAAQQISEAIEYFNKCQKVDVLIVGRGGGSIEDLWAFNEEITARAIFASRIPIISAVGHETDFTISDFVADLRAPTPSAAAELAVPDSAELAVRLKNLNKRLSRGLTAKVTLLKRTLAAYESVLTHRRFKIKLDGLRQTVDHMFARLEHNMLNCLGTKKEQLGIAGAKLNALSPMSALDRGYCVVMGKGGKLLTQAKDAQIGERITVKLKQGMLGCEVVNRDKEL